MTPPRLGNPRATRMGRGQLEDHVAGLEAVALRGQPCRARQERAELLEVNRQRRHAFDRAGQGRELVAAEAVLGRLSPHPLAPRRQTSA